MIKVNIELDNKSWYSQIKDLKKYFNFKLQKISKNIVFFNKKKFVFTILLTNSKKMKNLNKKFRKKNKPTDVLSFPFLPETNLRYSKRKIIYLGDLAVSYDIINHRSKKTNFHIEFDKAWVHGLLHLVGYDHIKNKDYFKMSKVEKRILNLI
jgi:probable rRNA maturation factor